MLANLPHPAIFAHRGASLDAPENTLPAFETAIQLSADAIELDVKLSQDHEVIVIHDQTVDRTTDGVGRVDQLALSDLRQLDAGGWFSDSFQGVRIPTLEEVFEQFGREIYINIELTNYAAPTDSLPARVAELVNRMTMQNRVLFSSFNPIALGRIGRLVPEAPRGLLAMKGARGRWARSWLAALIPHQCLHPALEDTTASLLSWAHKRSRRVYTYTVNGQDDMRALFALGSDGIFTDDPRLAIEVRSEYLG